ncbi:hypothetical protein K239x_31930 [Planctomycetes bacterium K23_9]|uniref:Uncharacterized protein n=1 Tax=Stieleria marina TaxID=1930275 RepID=A0A517NVP7_9BACT|nr:hypothetical protein K239x_31930 [Planctomycetes bacterium K23_9]
MSIVTLREGADAKRGGECDWGADPVAVIIVTTGASDEG